LIKITDLAINKRNRKELFIHAVDTETNEEQILFIRRPWKSIKKLNQLGEEILGKEITFNYKYGKEAKYIVGKYKFSPTRLTYMCIRKIEDNYII